MQPQRHTVFAGRFQFQIYFGRIRYHLFCRSIGIGQRPWRRRGYHPNSRHHLLISSAAGCTRIQSVPFGLLRCEHSSLPQAAPPSRTRTPSHRLPPCVHAVAAAAHRLTSWGPLQFFLACLRSCGRYRCNSRLCYLENVPKVSPVAQKRPPLEPEAVSVDVHLWQPIHALGDCPNHARTTPQLIAGVSRLSVRPPPATSHFAFVLHLG